MLNWHTNINVTDVRLFIVDRHKFYMLNIYRHVGFYIYVNLAAPKNLVAPRNLTVLSGHIRPLETWFSFIENSISYHYFFNIFCWLGSCRWRGMGTGRGWREELVWRCENYEKFSILLEKARLQYAASLSLQRCKSLQRRNFRLLECHEQHATSHKFWRSRCATGAYISLYM